MGDECFYFEAKNFEEKGISLVGEKLYTTFIKNYSNFTR